MRIDTTSQASLGKDIDKIKLFGGYSFMLINNTSTMNKSITTFQWSMNNMKV